MVFLDGATRIRDRPKAAMRGERGLATPHTRDRPMPTQATRTAWGLSRIRDRPSPKPMSVNSRGYPHTRGSTSQMGERFLWILPRLPGIDRSAASLIAKSCRLPAYAGILFETPDQRRHSYPAYAGSIHCSSD